MIKDSKIITQDYDFSTSRATESKVQFKRKLFGITIYTWTEDFKETHSIEENQAIGFNK